MGKSSAPAAPDYAAAAEKTAQGNLEATRAATAANRINQYTPYGSLTYSQTPTKTYNYDAYNKALADYNAGGSQAPAAQSPFGQLTSGFNRRADLEAGGAGIAPLATATAARTPMARPDLETFATTNPDSGWEQRMNLTPEAQKALDQELALNRKYGEVANIGFDKVRGLFESPELDMSGLPARAINVGQTAQDAIMSRLRPQLDQQAEALRTRMANQGITLGSDAYGKEMTAQGQQANDLQMQAALQGINLDQANRSAALQEQAYLQDRPLNLINALRGGNQVNAPQFQQFAQQATTSGPNYSGAAQLTAESNAANQANQSNAMGGLFSLGGAAIGGLYGGIPGAQLGAGLGGAAGRSFY